MEISIIVGLPGSGKTFLGKALSKIYNINFFDDCVSDQSMWNSVLAEISKCNSCILSDPKLCHSDIMKELINRIKSASTCQIIIKYYYFKNEPEICIKNISTRDDGRVVSNEYVTFLSKIYSPPPPDCIPCYRASNK